MKLYCAVVDAETVRMFHEMTKGTIKLNVLISYFYIKGNAHKLTNLYRHMIDSLIMDSGAYSVAMGKSKISVTEYKLYLKRYGHLFDCVFNLDDKFDNPEHNQRHQDYLQKDVAREKWPIPVVHSEDDPEGEVQIYVNQGHEYIALGSLGKNRIFDADTVARIMEKFPDIKFHLFGNFDREILTKCKPYSADSATWGHKAGYGSLYYWDPDEKKEYSIYMEHRDTKQQPGQILYRDLEPKLKVKFDKFLASTFGYDYARLLSDQTSMHIVNIYFFTQLESYINSLPAR